MWTFRGHETVASFLLFMALIRLWRNMHVRSKHKSTKRTMETNAKTMECIDSNSSCSWSLPVASSDVLEWVVNEGHI